MFQRPSGWAFPAAIFATLLPLASVLRADTDLTNLGKQVKDFTLKDTAGERVSLASFKDKKAIVVIFIGTQCPVNNLYMPRLAELAKEYQKKDVQFLAINSNRQDTGERVASHARKYGLPFPVLKDEGNEIADRFGARRTPEAFVLDRERTIRYQGRIDDHYGISYQRPRPTRRDLALAVDEVLALKTVTRPWTPVAGCLIARVTPVRSEGAITYTKHIARILQKNCQECHRPGQIGPMSLLTYDDAASWADTIREVVEEGRMPPWDADPRYGRFMNDRRLSAEDKKTLLAWIDQGKPRGGAKDLPPPRRFESEWLIGKPDMIFTMPKTFEVPAEMPRFGIPYKYFYVNTDFKEDRWIQRAEARAGAPDVVHHIIVFIIPPGVRFFPGNPQSPTLGGTAPGDMPMLLPPGTAKKIPRGSRLVFQMHYTPNGKAQKDRSSIGIVFAKKPPRLEVKAVPVFNALFRIPPRAPNHRVEASYIFKRDGYVMNFMPHMHLRGKDFKYEAIYPDGKRETLLWVPRYNFNWQSIYRLAKPVPMPKGTKLLCIAHYDNSPNNPNNPDPNKGVSWGDQTWQEMMIGWADFAFTVPSK
jgi:peroxiredoxin/mono/diheme cytochrome c family protein